MACIRLPSLPRTHPPKTPRGRPPGPEGAQPPGGRSPGSEGGLASLCLATPWPACAWSAHATLLPPPTSTISSPLWSALLRPCLGKCVCAHGHMPAAVCALGDHWLHLYSEAMAVIRRSPMIGWGVAPATWGGGAAQLHKGSPPAVQ